MKRIRCALLRGGTSKAVFLLENDLPKDLESRNRILRKIMGSPDPRQIDGLGGADILTSKVAIIGPRTRPDADVNYTFAQVDIHSEVVSYQGNCGNISAAVGLFAIDEGFVRAVEPRTQVRIYNTNTEKIILAEVPVREGKAQVEGDYQIDGVPGTGAKILLDYSNSVGSATGKLLPTDQVKEFLTVERVGKVKVSIVDVANPMVFVRAESLGLQGTESPKSLDQDKDLLEKMEAIRGTAAVLLGFVSDWREAMTKSPYLPFFAIVGPPKDYRHFQENLTISEKQIDLTSRLVGMGQPHKAYPGTGAICIAAASRIPDTIVYETIPESSRESGLLRIGHPWGVMEVEVKAEQIDGKTLIRKVAMGRTARRIMDGYVYVRG